MDYQVVKVFNNNVVLAKKEQEEVVLVSKGVGFGRKIGDFIKDDGNIEKVFHESIDSSMELKHISAFTHKINELTRYIIKIAEEQLGNLNENSEKTLLEHIEFAIERLGMGLVIENPFIDEIVTLYKKEYMIAGIARNYIEEQIGIDIGEEEQGFIALHLHSAKKNKPVKEVMRATIIYKECLNKIEAGYDCENNFPEAINKELFRMLNFYTDLAMKEARLYLPLKSEVASKLKKSFHVANQVADLIEKEKSTIFSEDIRAYIALDLEKLMQLK